MTHHDFDLAVIGGGCIGASILHELSLRGLGEIVLIDQGRLTVSATASSGGMLRVFHESAAHLELALENHSLLPEDPKASGSLYFFHRDRLESFRENFERMERARYPFELISMSEGSERFPDFTWGPEEFAVFEPKASFSDPLNFCEELLQGAVTRGARLLDDWEVLRICPYLDRYRIVCDKGTITSKRIVLAGGARLLPRLADLSISYPLKTRTIRAHVARRNSSKILPSFIDRETLEFGRFAHPEKIILSSPKLQRMRSIFWEEIFTETSALDCCSPERRGLLGQMPGARGAIIATGWGGGAFKFARSIGRRVAIIAERDFHQRTQINA